MGIDVADDGLCLVLASSTQSQNFKILTTPKEKERKREKKRENKREKKKEKEREKKEKKRGEKRKRKLMWQMMVCGSPAASTQDFINTKGNISYLCTKVKRNPRFRRYTLHGCIIIKGIKSNITLLGISTECKISLGRVLQCSLSSQNFFHTSRNFLQDAKPLVPRNSLGCQRCKLNNHMKKV